MNNKALKLLAFSFDVVAAFSPCQSRAQTPAGRDEFFWLGEISQVSRSRWPDFSIPVIQLSVNRPLRTRTVGGVGGDG